MEFEKQDIYEDVESTSASSESERAGFIGGSIKTMDEPRRPLGLDLSVLRVAIELGLAIILLGLIASGSIHFSHGETKYRKFGPTLPRKEVILGNAAGFGPPIEYNNQEMLQNRTEMARIHRNWQQLFPKGRGYISVKPSDDFEVLHPPFEMWDVLTDGDHYEGYIMAVYHQLHCLSILTTSLPTSIEDWKEMNPKIKEHRSHCVEYLRQSILCSGDTTLEGETGSWTKSTGWGQTHSCVDYDALTGWANDRAIWDLSGQLLPQNFDFHKADVEGKPRNKVDESKLIEEDR
ncbi:hypothetical protein N0V90_011224 [Kalmusia sp. IMI 367209]|nr:hypothetical protein N0V90_011224 [Kalmusia sp. IMI 367209]